MVEQSWRGGLRWRSRHPSWNDPWFVRRCLPLLLLLIGCSAGPASVQSSWDPEAHAVRFTFSTDGKNTFTVAGRSCEAPRGGSCTLEVPAADLPAGWNDVIVDTRRRTGMDPPLSARVFLGREAFDADCDVVDLALDPPAFDIACAFRDGFHGEIAGRAMEGGKARVLGSDVSLDGVDVGIHRPVVRAPLPVEVVNRVGARWIHTLPLTLPVSLVQLEVGGHYPIHYETELTLTLRTEPGAEVIVDGRRVAGAASPKGVRHTVHLELGPNRVRVEARAPGRIASVRELEVDCAYPATPLYIDAPPEAAFVTDKPTAWFRGRTMPGAKVYVDSYLMPVAKDGAFEVPITLIEGPNEVSVLAVLEGRPGQRERRVTRASYQIEYNPNPAREQEVFLGKTSSTDALDAAQALAGDPWDAVGRKVRFPLVVEQVGSTPRAGGCVMRLEGVGCTRQVGRDVLVNFKEVTGWACAGDEFPVVVDLDECPIVRAGDRLLITGTLQGGAGGRWHLKTVERPRVQAAMWQPAPWVAPRERR